MYYSLFFSPKLFRSCHYGDLEKHYVFTRKGQCSQLSIRWKIESKSNNLRSKYTMPVLGQINEAIYGLYVL